MNETNKILITRIKQGDKHEFNRLFFKYYAALCSYVTTIIEDSSVSEDIVQNMFIKFWSGRSKIAIHTNIEHYLFKAAKNGALNHLRSETNRKKALDKLEIIDCMEIEESSIQEEFLQKLEDCINQLPERSKEVFLLSRFEELKQKEIAEKLSISIKTIKNQIWKSLKYLKSCMEFKNAC